MPVAPVPMHQEEYQMANPCYYKTNEGYFYINQEEEGIFRDSKRNQRSNLNLSNVTSHNNSMSQLDIS